MSGILIFRVLLVIAILTTGVVAAVVTLAALASGTAVQIGLAVGVSGVAIAWKAGKKV